ncbi:DUF2891 domain-containing protein [Alteriqipengyuania lutimaris]|uniref:DUF2891 domain-containing protein n=1 Tax=Alteriqipengyuania lutimaris TaxID=1538146 RepID=A0A395LLD8_9SPHN|nr:DUF2891 domain-containing protein [Alteriqipengyuania lutimaris]MBB3033821.1 hypothetical protein [Alteriqipengyuania lutimaris]RDS77207.1 DUF2891 domain-containing protein [Alteriqipengyuania lutimaris]
MELSEDTARRFAQAALGHVAREYPHKLDHVMDGDADVRPPRALHPVFFGSFDWHSCVHGWWTLLTLRRLFPEMPEAARIAELAESSFTPEKLAVELAYAQRPSSRGFERPYGWGWLLYLHHEAARHDARWAARLEPLARHFASAFRQYLAVLTYPVFVGTHYNTAFALTLAREWAEDRDPELAGAIDAWTRAAFAHRSDYRGWEPGGDEFLSPVLSAAMPMRHALPPSEFARWFAALVLDNGWVERLEPASVSDRSDGKIAHLDGLNLSRAWCLRAIAPCLRAEDRNLLHAMAAAHLDAALPHVTGDYMGEHWLASFALLALLADAPR